MHVTLPLFITTFSLYILAPTITQTSLRASLLQWLENGQQPSSFSFPTNLAGAAFGVQRRCLDSERLPLCRRRRPARRPLRLLPRRGRRRRRRRHPSSGVVASKSMYLHRLSAALEAATPSLSSTSLLVEVSSERAAQMEGDASGCDGACVGDRLGLGLEPNPSLLMEGSMFPQINGL